VDPEPLITRDELVEYLFSVVDIRDDVSAIRTLLEEDGNGGEAEEEAT
jgi:hypothetical protein